jgi:hypothetical protein
MRTAVFWNIMPCILVVIYAWEERTLSVFRVAEQVERGKEWF